MRLRTMAIFGLGYLVGTRAGRERFEQIAGGVREMAQSDMVQGYLDRALDVARRPLSAEESTDELSDEVAGDDATEADGEESDDDTRRGSASRSRSGRSR